MTPPSTLQLGGLAAMALGLFLMAANGSEARVVQPEPAQAQMVYAFAQLAVAEANLTATRTHQLSHKLVHARAVAAAHDSVIATVRVSAAPAPVVKLVQR